MNEQQQTLDTLKDIRSLMERSSRFISLSGWSGVAAGVCALVGAWAAKLELKQVMMPVAEYHGLEYKPAAKGLAGYERGVESFISVLLSDRLFHIAMLTFISALVSAFLFTWFKSRKQQLPIWDAASKRLLVNLGIPLLTGGLFILKMIEMGDLGLVAPACLIFYGLALLNASKYTFIEIRYLALAQLVLGIMNCWSIGNGLYFWAAGFGLMHIVYGLVMWKKYEK